MNASTIMTGYMIEEALPLSSTPRTEDPSVTGTATTDTDTGSARQETGLDTAISSTTTTMQRIASSLDHDTKSPSSGGNDAESEAVSIGRRSDHAAAMTTTTTELSHSLDVSTRDTDKDASAYIDALVSAIATVPDTGVLAGGAASSGDSVFRLPNGQVVTSKNTLMSHSTVADRSTNGTRRNSNMDDELNGRHARGVPVPSSPSPMSAAPPILVNVVHATQDHAGNASLSPPLILATVVSGAQNEPTDRAAPRGNNRSSGGFKQVCFRVCAVAMFAILLISVTSLVTFYLTSDGETSRAVESVTSPTENNSVSLNAPPAVRNPNPTATLTSTRPPQQQPPVSPPEIQNVNGSGDGGGGSTRPTQQGGSVDDRETWENVTTVLGSILGGIVSLLFIVAYFRNEARLGERSNPKPN